MKKLIVIVMIALALGAQAKGIKWDQVAAGCLFGGLSYWMITDGSAQVETTVPYVSYEMLATDTHQVTHIDVSSSGITTINCPYTTTFVTSMIRNTGNCEIKNLHVRFFTETGDWDPVRRGIFGSGQELTIDLPSWGVQQSYSFTMSVGGEHWCPKDPLSRSVTITYDKQYKNKSDTMIYGGIALACVSAYMILDGLGIFGGDVNTAGLDMQVDLAKLGDVNAKLVYRF